MAVNSRSTKNHLVIFQKKRKALEESQNHEDIFSNCFGTKIRTQSCSFF